MSDRKGTHNAPYHRSRSRRRKFEGNQFTFEKDTEYTTTSASKILSSESDIVIDPGQGYCIISFLSVFTAIAQLIVCKDCKKNINFGEAGHRGLGFKIVLTCECGDHSIHSGPLIDNRAYEINKRLVLAMRLLGIGQNGIKLFCGLMDLGNGISKTVYDSVMSNIYTASKAVFELLTKKAVKEEKEKNIEKEMPISNLIVSGDGTWKKRGFSSLFGVSTLIGSLTGKVIDAVVKSCYCQGCTYWKHKDKNTEQYAMWHDEHEENCSVNHAGSAGKMEMDSVKEMFSRSEELHQVRYVNYIGDGDSKTFKGILDLQPYGEDCIVKKSEDINHVHKRMGTRLRNLKKSKKFKRGVLTDALIKKLSTYYGLAIRRHNNVQDMKNAIMATLHHMTSTNDSPNHSLCPPGVESWCKWRRAEASGTHFQHNPPLAPELVTELLPIYHDLSKEDLLERCIGGHTQNSNESLNSCIWRLAPKHLHCGLKTVQIATFLSCGIFNEGYYAILKTMKTMGIRIGPKCKAVADAMDGQRLDSARRKSTGRPDNDCTTDEAAQTTDFYEENEPFYGPGIAD